MSYCYGHWYSQCDAVAIDARIKHWLIKLKNSELQYEQRFHKPQIFSIPFSLSFQISERLPPTTK